MISKSPRIISIIDILDDTPLFGFKYLFLVYKNLFD